jgi:hypothetical protein
MNADLANSEVPRSRRANSVTRHRASQRLVCRRYRSSRGGGCALGCRSSTRGDLGQLTNHGFGPAVSEPAINARVQADGKHKGRHDPKAPHSSKTLAGNGCRPHGLRSQGGWMRYCWLGLDARIHYGAPNDIGGVMSGCGAPGCGRPPPQSRSQRLIRQCHRYSLLFFIFAPGLPLSNSLATGSNRKTAKRQSRNCRNCEDQ